MDEKLFNLPVRVFNDDFPEPNESEREACEIVAEALREDFDFAAFSVEKKSKDYTTLVYKQYDVMRVKISDRVKWLSVYVLGKDAKAYAEDPRFDLQANKKQLMWKASFDSFADVLSFMHFFEVTCQNADKHAATTP